MKVLFLDIDGVLNSDRTAFAHGGYPHNFSPDHLALFDRTAIALVRRLCADHGVQIVLSSTWRYHFPVWKVAEGLDLPVIGHTPKPADCEYMNRGREIALWLSEHPEVTHYAIVDDINAMLPEQQPYFVQTDERDGLSLGDYARLAHILNDPDLALTEPSNP
jgi:hypothetical protein